MLYNFLAESEPQASATAIVADLYERLENPTLMSIVNADAGIADFKNETQGPLRWACKVILPPAGVWGIRRINTLFPKVERSKALIRVLDGAMELRLNRVISANSTACRGFSKEEHRFLSSKQIGALPRSQWLPFLES
jgi:hypothetical protein